MLHGQVWFLGPSGTVAVGRTIIPQGRSEKEATVRSDPQATCAAEHFCSAI
jgi:hypothetical protein